MKHMKKIILSIIIPALSLSIIVTDWTNETTTSTIASTTASTVNAPPISVPQKSIAPANVLVLQKVAFISQAPTGKWSDPRQQDGCEEASVIMAVNWARGKKMASKAEVAKQIVAISDWENKNYKQYHDTSIQDTADRILKNYFKFNNFEIKNNITTTDIKKELYLGNVVIIPVSGVKLKNPNFVPPGPEHHMILVIGYDPKTKQFITNDPGTRLGSQYRYSEKIINDALRDYPTGNHAPVTKVKKNMIVVKPENILSSPLSINQHH